jgi:hypothetical protein
MIWRCEQSTSWIPLALGRVAMMPKSLRSNAASVQLAMAGHR